MKATAFGFLILLTLTAPAQNIQYGPASYRGKDCPAGSFSFALSPDQSDFSLLVDSFQAESGKPLGTLQNAKTCTVLIPVRMPQGYQGSLVTHVKGYVATVETARATYNQEVFFGGSRAFSLAKVFEHQNNSFQIASDSLSTTAWSSCNGNTLVRVDINLSTQGESQAILSLDQLSFEWKLKKCNAL